MADSLTKGDAAESETAGGDGAGDSEDLSVDADEIADIAGTTRENGEELEVGEIFELLKNKRRRQVIKFLKEQEDGAATLDVVAEHIAAKENDIDVSQLSSKQRKRVYIGLYQCHLPKMDDLGILEYQQNRGTIELQNTDQLDRYLETDDDGTDGRTELTVAVGVGLIVAVGLTGIGPLAAVPAVLWTALSVFALFVLAAI